MNLQKDETIPASKRLGNIVGKVSHEAAPSLPGASFGIQPSDEGHAASTYSLSRFVVSFPPLSLQFFFTHPPFPFINYPP